MPTTGPDPHPPRLSAATTVVGVIGDPVAHSLSPLLHNAAFAEMGLDWVSVGFRVPPGSAGDAIAGARALGVRGLSVTMPHKAAAAALVDGRLAVGRAPGRRQLRDLRRARDVRRQHRRSGPGGRPAPGRPASTPPGGIAWSSAPAAPARAVVAALADAGAAEVVVVNRTPERAISAAALAGPAGRVGSPADAAGCQLVVNATPLGMVGADGGSSPSWPVDPTLLRRRPGGGGPGLPSESDPVARGCTWPGCRGVERHRHARPPGCAADWPVGRASNRRSRPCGAPSASQARTGDRVPPGA